MLTAFLNIYAKYNVDISCSPNYQLSVLVYTCFTTLVLLHMSFFPRIYVYILIKTIKIK